MYLHCTYCIRHKYSIHVSVNIYKCTYTVLSELEIQLYKAHARYIIICRHERISTHVHCTCTYMYVSLCTCIYIVHINTYIHVHVHVHVLPDAVLCIMIQDSHKTGLYDVITISNRYT